jgi:hypothetical protein
MSRINPHLFTILLAIDPAISPITSHELRRGNWPGKKPLAAQYLIHAANGAKVVGAASIEAPTAAPA